MEISKILSYEDGKWRNKRKPSISISDHCLWLSSTVFDGARSIGGRIPDIQAHCERLIQSARLLLLEPKVSAKEIEHLCIEGLRKLNSSKDIYIKTMFFARDGSFIPNPNTTTFGLILSELPIPSETHFTACLSSYQRPNPSMAPTGAKASCLYPLGQLAVHEANKNGFDTCALTNANGNVVDFANANLWLVKDGKYTTPESDGTFLNGITKQRLKKILTSNGFHIIEKAITAFDLMYADELFSTGNYALVQRCSKFEERKYTEMEMFNIASKLYIEYISALETYI